MDGRRAPPLSPLAKLVSAGLTWALLGIGISLQQQAKWRPSNIRGYASSLLYLSDTGGCAPGRVLGGFCDVGCRRLRSWKLDRRGFQYMYGGGPSPARNVGGFKGYTYNYFEF